MVGPQLHPRKKPQSSLTTVALCFWSFIMPCIQPVWAQVSGHQRLGIEAKTHWEADIEGAVRLRSAGYSDYSLPDLDSSLSFGLLLDNTWSTGLSIPFSVSSWPVSTPHLLLVPGDVTVSAGYTAIRGAVRVRGSINLTGPSACWQGNQEIPGSVAGGSGRWTLGLSGGLSRILDPLVLGGQVSWSVGLPRAERWESRWRPGDFSLVLSATEAFNEHISATAVLSQYVSIPGTAWGIPRGSMLSGDVAYDAAAGVRLSATGRSFSGSIGFSKGLVHGADPASLDFSVAYFIRRKEGP
jgi:hypothetical protein